MTILSNSLCWLFKLALISLASNEYEVTNDALHIASCVACEMAEKFASATHLHAKRKLQLFIVLYIGHIYLYTFMDVRSCIYIHLYSVYIQTQTLYIWSNSSTSCSSVCIKGQLHLKTARCLPSPHSGLQNPHSSFIYDLSIVSQLNHCVYIHTHFFKRVGPKVSEE